MILPSVSLCADFQGAGLLNDERKDYFILI